MLYWSIQVLIISIVFILIVDNIFHFLRDTLTIPKIKDLVNAPTKQYEDIYKVINTSNENTRANVPDIMTKGVTSIDMIPTLGQEEKPTLESIEKKNSQQMKDELKNFMKSHLNNNKNEKEPQYVSLY